jgi:hypothetical protein
MDLGRAVAQLVEAPCYNPQGRGFVPDFVIDLILPATLWL